ncbi:MAG: hypothetical protein RL297_651 [Pseudomonadota bacterium]|jgi:8-oxo-dGTP pyrophosphatase MutT (NUDIX family)
MRTPWPTFDPAFEQRWAQRAQPAPTDARTPLWLGGVVVGSVAHAMLEHLSREGFQPGWRWMPSDWGDVLYLPEDPTTTFAALRQHLFDPGQGGLPEAERLPLWDDQGRVHGAVPRDLARYLGVHTHSVHVLGWQGDACWVQERAANKAEDPGRLDTLVGGTVAWNEHPSATLVREAWEEAGLGLRQLVNLTAFGPIELNKPSGDARGWGQTVETIHCYSAELEAGVEPLNQDGEVAAFYRFEREALTHALEADRFTLAATGVFLRVLQA